MATHSNILAWEIPWTEEPDGLQSMGRKELGRTQQPNNNNHIQCDESTRTTVVRGNQPIPKTDLYEKMATLMITH